MFKTAIFVLAICGIAISTPLNGRIFNGDIVLNDSTFPFVVSLFSNIRGIIEIGGGTIITSNAVLTAARVVQSAQYTDVGYGSRFVSFQTVQRVYPTNIVYYPQYNSTFYSHNIALIRLPIDIVFNLYAQPIQLARRTSAVADYFNGQTGTIMGWGIYSENENLYSDILKTTPKRIIKNVDCASVFSSNVVISATMCSIGYTELENNACSGDFGGPLIVQESGVLTQIGVISFGRACPSESPTGYSSVAFYLNWISQQTGLIIRE